MNRRWLRLVLLATLAALPGCGDPEENPAPGRGGGGDPAVAEPGKAPDPSEPLPGMPERGPWEIRQVVSSVRPGDREGAERAIERLEEIRVAYAGQPVEIDALMWTARLSIDIGRPEKAAEAHLAAAKLLPPQFAVQARFEAVSAYHVAGKLERCLSLLDEIEGMEGGPPSGIARAIPMERAAVLMALDRTEEALAVYRRELKTWGDRLPGRRVRLALAGVLVEMGRDAEARALCEDLWPRLRLEPEGCEAGILLADLRERASEVPAARTILESIEKVADLDLSARVRARRARMALVGKPMPALPADVLVAGPAIPAGRRLVVVFWDPARIDSAHAMQQWQRALAQADVALLGVVLGADRERALAGIEEHGVTVETRLGDGETARSWRITNVPTTFVIGPDGRVETTAWPTGAASHVAGR